MKDLEKELEETKDLLFTVVKDKTIKFMPELLEKDDETIDVFIAQTIMEMHSMANFKSITSARIKAEKAANQ